MNLFNLKTIEPKPTPIVPIRKELPETRLLVDALETDLGKQMPEDVMESIYRVSLSINDGGFETIFDAYSFSGDESSQEKSRWVTIKDESLKGHELYLKLIYVDGKFSVFYSLDNQSILGENRDQDRFEIPVIKIVLKRLNPEQSFFKQWLKPSIELGFPVINLEVQKVSKRKCTLCIDLGYFGNTIRLVHRGSDTEPGIPLTAPLLADEIYEHVQFDGQGEAIVTSKFTSELLEYQATDFSTAYISDHESIGPKGSLIGARADECLKMGDLSLMQSEKAFWSTKSKVFDESYIEYLEQLVAGLARKVPLMYGKMRKMNKYNTATEIYFDVEVDKILCSVPNTWHEAKRDLIREKLSMAFGISKSKVIAKFDEATAASIGYFAGRFGNDMSPSRQLSMMSEDTLFAQVEDYDQKPNLKRLATYCEPLTYLVIDAGAGTTDIALMQIKYDEKLQKVVAKTIGKQGFEAGGLNISKELCAYWKERLRIKLKKLGLNDGIIREILTTNIEAAKTQSISSEEKRRRHRLLVSLYECAELVKLIASEGKNNHDQRSGKKVNHVEDLEYWIHQVCDALNRHEVSELYKKTKKDGIDEKDALFQDVKAIISVDDKLVNRFSAMILGPCFYSAADIPVQYQQQKLDAILMIGRTLRLPNLTQSFIDRLKERAQQVSNETGQDWSQLVPPPHAIHSWNQDQLLRGQFRDVELSDLHPNEDKRCVSNGLAMIASSMERGADDLSFIPQDKHYRQAYVGAIRQHAATWHETIVDGVAPGKMPEVFNPGDNKYSLVMGSEATEVSLYWNNLGVKHKESIEITIAGERYKLEEPIIDLGKLTFDFKDEELRNSSSIKCEFTLIEDHRLKLESATLIMNTYEDSDHLEEKAAETVDATSQRVETEKYTVTYTEEEYDSDFRNTGIINEYDSDLRL